MEFIPPVDVVFLEYQPDKRELHVRLIGHPTETLERARMIGVQVLGLRRWHITVVAGAVPTDYDHPDEFSMDVKMQAFEI